MLVATLQVKDVPDDARQRAVAATAPFVIVVDASAFLEVLMCSASGLAVEALLDSILDATDAGQSGPSPPTPRHHQLRAPWLAVACSASV